MVTVEAKVKGYLDKIKKEDKKINAFLEVNEHALQDARAIDKKKKKGKLAGYVFGVKSNINVLGLTASCASKTLEDYKATYDASVIEKIKTEDGVIIGMLNCDEFACGFSGELSAYGPTQNPAAPGMVPGGSSSGSAAAVAAGFCDVALGSDTGGSVRVPASFCGVVGVKPSYGSVSRYGLVDLSMSLDQIGPVARDVKDAELVFDIIAGVDERDTTTRAIGQLETVKSIGTLHVNGVDKKIEKHVAGVVDKLTKELKLATEDVDIKGIDLAIQTYHPLAWTEFFSATRRFDGRRYGKKIEDSAGEEVVRRIYGGSEISKAEFKGRYYQKALVMQQRIKEEFVNAFSGVDCIISPTVSMLPWKLGSKLKLEELYAVDALTIPANLAGICAISLPAGTIDGKPVGLQLMCAPGKEKQLFAFAKKVEAVLNKL